MTAMLRRRADNPIATVREWIAMRPWLTGALCIRDRAVRSRRRRLAPAR